MRQVTPGVSAKAARDGEPVGADLDRVGREEQADAVAAALGAAAGVERT